MNLSNTKTGYYLLTMKLKDFRILLLKTIQANLFRWYLFITNLLIQKHSPTKMVSLKSKEIQTAIRNWCFIKKIIPF
jgi:hypothetical protein